MMNNDIEQLVKYQQELAKDQAKQKVIQKETLKLLNALNRSIKIMSDRLDQFAMKTNIKIDNSPVIQSQSNDFQQQHQLHFQPTTDSLFIQQSQQQQQQPLNISSHLISYQDIKELYPLNSTIHDHQNQSISSIIVQPYNNNSNTNAVTLSAVGAHNNSLTTATLLTNTPTTTTTTTTNTTTNTKIKNSPTKLNNSLISNMNTNNNNNNLNLNNNNAVVNNNNNNNNNMNQNRQNRLSKLLDVIRLD
jgi:hypothetical protein